MRTFRIWNGQVETDVLSRFNRTAMLTYDWFGRSSQSKGRSGWCARTARQRGKRPTVDTCEEIRSVTLGIGHDFLQRLTCVLVVMATLVRKSDR